jgi:type IX secretion system PorP/SprF family membrane protein
LDNPTDPSFQNLNPSLFLPNFGAGIYARTKNWFVGLSSPLLITNALRKRTPNEPMNLPIAQQYRHYYFSAGGVFELSPSLKFRPSILVKNVGLFMDRNELNGIAAPTEFNVDLGFLFNDRIWFGTSFRSAIEVINGSSSYDSVDFWFSMRMNNGFRFGLAYDYTLTRIQAVGIGSYEIMLGYDLCRPNVDKVEHVRYF